MEALGLLVALVALEEMDGDVRFGIIHSYTYLQGPTDEMTTLRTDAGSCVLGTWRESALLSEALKEAAPRSQTFIHKSFHAVIKKLRKDISDLNHVSFRS